MGIKFKFKPLFVIYVFLCIYFNWFNKIFYYVVTVTIHEYGHYLCAKHYGYHMDTIVFSVSGAGLTNSNNFKPKDEIKIALAGPLVNLVLITIIIAFFWIVPMSYLYTYDFLVSNIVVMIFNLLPMYPLDGGRIIIAYLTLKHRSRDKMLRSSRILCFVFGTIFLVLFIMSLFFKINYNLAIISCFLTINGVNSSKSKYFDKVSALNKKLDKPLEVKVFKVADMDKSTLIKNLSPHYYSVFQLTDENGKVQEIEEKDLLN